jgi:hypothetical protein
MTRGEKEAELVHVVEEMDQEHTKRNATMMNKGEAIYKRIMT